MVQGEFVGRRRELAYLRGWLTAAVGGQPRLVLCGGEPGIGKTRLASELAKVGLGELRRRCGVGEGAGRRRCSAVLAVATGVAVF